jgi:hypothetical protein
MDDAQENWWRGLTPPTFFACIPREGAVFFSKAFLSFFHTADLPNSLPDEAFRRIANCQPFSGFLEAKQPKMCDGNR